MNRWIWKQLLRERIMSIDKSQSELFRNFVLAFVNPDWYLVHPLHKDSQEKCWILRTFLSICCKSSGGWGILITASCPWKVNCRLDTTFSNIKSRSPLHRLTLELASESKATDFFQTFKSREGLPGTWKKRKKTVKDFKQLSPTCPPLK